MGDKKGNVSRYRGAQGANRQGQRVRPHESFESVLSSDFRVQDFLGRLTFVDHVYQSVLQPMSAAPMSSG